MQDGTVLRAKRVVSNATPYHTFLELLPGYQSLGGHPTGLTGSEGGEGGEGSPVPAAFNRHIRFADQACGAMKINVAVDQLPNFLCCPSPADGRPGPQHMGTIHFEEKMEELENGFREASLGIPASRPAIEMTIPSALDDTLAPRGKHVINLFVQYAPYDLDPKVGNWADEDFKNGKQGACPPPCLSLQSNTL